MNLEVVTRELLGPSDLTRTEALCIYELTEVIVVSKDEDLVFTAFQVLVPSLKDLHNAQELLIVGFVISLSGDYLLREKSN